MLELIFIVCLISKPTACHEEHTTFMQPALSQMACMRHGAYYAAQWIEAHPKYRLKKWTCRQAGMVAKI